MTETTHEISAVRRTVGSRTLGAGEARVLSIARTYPSAPADVWDACTNPERIPRWFLPVSGDLRLGGRYQLEGNAGGVVERCEPPHSFGVTWEFGGEVSWVEVRLAEAPDGGTQFELEHVAHVADEFWNSYGPGAVGVGWDLGLLGLAIHLRTGEAVDHEKDPAWVTSAEGRAAVFTSSEGWRDASVAAGTDPAAAQAAADGTTAFYTGTGDPEPAT